VGYPLGPNDLEYTTDNLDDDDTDGPSMEDNDDAREYRAMIDMEIREIGRLRKDYT
jgi:hypothetical protein